jgi:hypothetical protein
MSDDIKDQQKTNCFSCLTWLLNDPLQVCLLFSILAGVSDSENEPYGVGIASSIPTKSWTPTHLGRRQNVVIN